jgi:transposase
MESTGVYWIPLYDVLEKKGFKVYLVNARQLKNVPGRKTDVLDCQWLQQLHTYGLLTASFRPEQQIRTLRDLNRHRDTLIAYRASHIQHMQKALHLMNIQLDNVITDITGLTGMMIIRSILAGERNPDVLARYRDRRCKSSREVIEKSLEGTYEPEHLFALRQNLELYEYYTEKIKECDREIENLYETIPPKVDDQEKPLPPAQLKHLRSQKHEPEFDLRSHLYRTCGVDLTCVNGLNAVTVQTVISEIGVDMSKFRTEKQLTAWLGLCPNRRVSGGKVLSTRTKKTKNRANTALRQAARSLHHSDSALGAYYRRMQSKLGAPKAITATAHKLARIIYLMLKYQKEYRDMGADYYERKYKERILFHLQKRARSLGYSLVPVAA